MRVITRMLFCLILSSLQIAYAADSMTLSVPFSNIVLGANKSISASYSFGQYPMIFCFTNNMSSVSTLVWPFRGRMYSGQMPVTLITNGNYQGQFADANGTVTVQNNQSSPMVVSCNYAF